MFKIRPIELKDIDQVFKQACELATRDGTMSPNFRLTKENMVEGLFGKNNDWYGLVATENDEIIGSCLYCFANTNRPFNPTGCLFLDILFVDEKHRGKGIGKKLLSELSSIATEKKLTRIEFWCMKDNIYSNKFYEMMGAEKIELLNVYNLNV